MENSKSPFRNDKAAKMPKDSTELLRNTLQSWADLHSKNLTDQAIKVWLGIFADTRMRVLELALDYVTHTAERMPTPGTLTKAIALVYERFPYLSEKERLTYRQGVDGKAVPCSYWSDEPGIPAYRAIDCAEGRAFLAQLAKVSGKTPDECAKLMEKWCQ